MAVGLLLLRLVVGLLFFGHGAQKLFGWFGGHGIVGTGGFLGSLGYRWSRTMAFVAGVVECFGGALLALGFLTPLACAALIGQMLNAAVAVHRRNGLWNADGGYELPLAYATVAASMALMGPGAWSLDSALELETDGIAVGIAAIVLGIVVGVMALGLRTTVAAPAARTEAADEREARAA
jgi:putative oxidoreductase